jgi:lysozyme
MKTNAEGKNLIALYKEEYEELESRTAAEQAVNLYVTRRLTSNQFSALVSLVMSIGIDDFRRSKLLKMVNAKADRDSLVKAADQFDLYIYAFDENGRRVVDQFLIEHRVFEKALFLLPELVKTNKKRKP